MDAFFIALLAFIGGTSIGWIAREIAALRAIRLLEEEADQQQNNDEHLVMIEITEQDGVFYTHRADNKQFLVQGRDHAEIRERLRKYFPNETFVASNENIERVKLPLIGD